MKPNRYYSLNQYLQEHFHEKCYKLALRGGETCPNRDGTVGYGGCIFCGEGSGSFASESIDEAIERLSEKHTGSRYIAYFQSYTSTYRMSEELIRKMYEAAEDDRIAAISIATRPDCLGVDDGAGSYDEYAICSSSGRGNLVDVGTGSYDKPKPIPISNTSENGKLEYGINVLELLADLNRMKPVWVELGLQTIHERTAKLIRRGYELPVFEEAVQQLRNLGIDVIVHLILGLPGETEDDMLRSVHYLNGCDIQGVKFQLLHVLKGTDLGEAFEKGKMSDNYPFTLDAYADLICHCISHLRPDIVVHRITGDAPKKYLLAPLWSGDKKKVLNTIRSRMEQFDVEQGKCLRL